jgi:AbrB family looped-hinge helix DNA binding protein
MKMKTITVSEKGQIVIPNSIRGEIGIEAGDELVIFEEKGKLLLEKVNSFSKRIKDDFKDIQKASEQNLKKIWDNKSDDIWEEYLK